MKNSPEIVQEIKVKAYVVLGWLEKYNNTESIDMSIIKWTYMKQ
jgi:hypothetical protein